MDIFEAIFTRRSIRKFNDKHIDDASVKKMLEAAMVAPSAGNSKPWRFIVVRNKQSFEVIAKHNPYAQMAVNSSICIVVCADLNAEKYQGYWQQDCSAAIQNMLLAARGLGIGTVWTGVYPDKERITAFKNYFELPNQTEILGIVVCGYPEGDFSARDNYNPQHVFAEKWGKF